MNRAYKYRIYPTKNQIGIFNFTLNNCRWLYNTALEHRREAYRISQKSISYKEQANELPDLKKQFPKFKNIHSQILQDVLKRVDKAYQNFFRRIKTKNGKAGFPRFQGKDRFDSFTYTQSGFSFTKDKKRIEFSKIGFVKIKLHRQIPVGSHIKTCTIKREQDKWFVCFSCEVPKIISENKTVSKAVGIDLGLTDFAVLSDGTEIKNPKYLKKSEAELKETQSKYSKKKSKKVKKKLQRLHRKVANQRKDFQHKLSRKLVNNFDLIAYEDLKVKKMISDATNSDDPKINKLQKHISDAAWGNFIGMMKYKAEEAGTWLVPINPRGTTKTCSSCGNVEAKKISERKHICKVCGYEDSRDHNAAINILRLGMSRMNENSLKLNYSSLTI